jgi:transposase
MGTAVDVLDDVMRIKRIWSLIASAERHSVDPQRYLTSVLAKIGQTPATEFDQFLPDAWKREDAAEPLAPRP